MQNGGRCGSEPWRQCEHLLPLGCVATCSRASQPENESAHRGARSTARPSVGVETAAVGATMASSSSSGAPSGSSAHAGAGGGPTDEAKLALIQQLMEIVPSLEFEEAERRLVERSWNIEAVLASHFAGSDAPASNASAAFDAPAGAELQRFCQRPFIVYESNLDDDFLFAPRQTPSRRRRPAQGGGEAHCQPVVGQRPVTRCGTPGGGRHQFGAGEGPPRGRSADRRD